DTGMADEGVVAIENSIEGSVNDTLDLLIHESNLVIRREVVLPINHCLLVKPGVKAAEVKAIYSHPQALGQCRRFLERCFPKAQVIAALSTTAAVEEMLSSEVTTAAIGTQRAAVLYGAELLARGIQDRSSNVTRFVVLAPTDHSPTGSDKTSLSFYIAEDRPGSLCDVLQEFSQREINLTKIESRPSKDAPWRYFFLVDLEGHKEDPVVAEALARVRDKTELLKVFGSYPRHVDAP
ncbi:MAG: prephenate dehydratase, partial [Chloroflexota bacterium]